MQGTSFTGQGFIEATGYLTFPVLKQMARSDTVINSILTAYCNKIASHAHPVQEKFETGFRIVLKNREEALLKVLESLYPKHFQAEKDTVDFFETDIVKKSESFRQKVISDKNPVDNIKDHKSANLEEIVEEYGITEQQMRYNATKELDRVTRVDRKSLQELLLNCGSLYKRPYEDRVKWNFKSFLTAVIRDSLTYDWVAIEKIRDKAGKLHSFRPLDASTIKWATPKLSGLKKLEDTVTGFDVITPGNENYIKEKNNFVLELNQKYRELGLYKFVQVINNIPVRAFTNDDIFVGIRNNNTDMQLRNYGNPELEKLLGLVTSHINAENLNKSFFYQGFSAKGILHVKGNMTKQSMAEFRAKFRSMISGNSNYSHIPMVQGVDDLKFVPLNSQKIDMEFTKWTNYLIKLMCAIYAIDPVEAGYEIVGDGVRAPNPKTVEDRIQIARSKGYLFNSKFLENLINKNIIDEWNPNYKIQFTGTERLSKDELIKQQQIEVQNYKTVNEVRMDLNLEPISGGNYINNQNHIMFTEKFSPEGKERSKEMAEEQQKIDKETAEHLHELEKEKMQLDAQLAPKPATGSSSGGSTSKKSGAGKKPKKKPVGSDTTSIKTRYDARSFNQNKNMGVIKSLNVEYEIEEDEDDDGQS